VANEQERLAAVRKNLDRIGRDLKRVNEQLREQKAAQQKLEAQRRRRTA
jgi:septal ring factor EnvC (AmiA/AmiB activator)